jgi:uncharacterized protein YceK
MKTLHPALIIALAASGCSHVSQYTTTTETATNGVQVVRESKARAYTLFDGRAAVQGVKISNGKTQGIGVEATDTQSSSTNVSGTLDALARLLGALPK